MPIPKPKKGDDFNTFIRRCVPVIIREGKPNDQAMAICVSTWEKEKTKGAKK